MRLIHRLVCCGLLLAVCGLGLAPPAHADGCIDEPRSMGGVVKCTVTQPAQQEAPAGPAQPAQPAVPQAQPGQPVGGAPAAPQPSVPRERICIPAFFSVYCGPEDTPAPAPPAEPVEPAEPAEPVAGLPEIVSQASLELGVPAPVVRLGPDPSWNKWKLLAVGLPIWLWTEGVQPQSAATSAEGIDIQMQAAPGGATVDWGDGTVIWCATMTSKTRYTDPLLMSPDCGHKYEHPGDYTITVTQQWIVDWAALDQKGQLQLQSVGTYPNLPIRNFHAVVTG